MFIYGWWKNVFFRVVLFMLTDIRCLFAWSCNLCKNEQLNEEISLLGGSYDFENASN